MKQTPSFESLGLTTETLQTLKKKGFEEPTQIQALTIPYLLTETKDIIGKAQTGTGKTAAFGLPILEKITPKGKSPLALILAPTRELAIQVAEELQSLKGNKNIKILPVYGGQSIDQQIKRLRSGVQIVVGTPGRIIDHLHRKTLNVEEIEYLVLDEADEMLNMGFVEDMDEILKFTPETKRTLLFSATMPNRILTLAKKYMKDYHLVDTKKHLTTSLTEQIYIEVSQSQKFEALCRIIDFEVNFYGLIFCRTKNDVDNVSAHLSDRGYEAEGIHGDVSQFQRERVLDKFRKQHLNILVATDVAARGIDIQDLTHVINYSLPQDPESYVHRIGRTGRAGKEGTAITFVTPNEYRQLTYIQRTAKADIKQVKIPKVDEIIQSKRERIVEDLTAIMELPQNDFFEDWTDELAQKFSERELLSSLLRFAFEDELNPFNYKEIDESPRKRNDIGGKVRLFVALGKTKGYTPKKIANFVESKTRIPGKRLSGIQVYDKFAFITTSFKDAESILQIFKQEKGGHKPIITRAKKK